MEAEVKEFSKWVIEPQRASTTQLRNYTITQLPNSSLVSRYIHRLRARFVGHLYIKWRLLQP
jgi:hypothetical protein